MVLVLFIIGVSFNSCAGQYALFNKAHPAIGNLGGKWIGAVVNWIAWGIIPILPICLLADAIIFNLIEFWSGNNIIASAGSLEQIDEAGNRIYAAKNDDGSLSVRVTEVTGEITDFLFERAGDDVHVFDSNGVLLSSMVYDASIN